MWHAGKLNTRTKIVSLETALSRDGRIAVVSGYFDPLIAEHVRRLRELRHGFDCLIVSVADPPAPILEASARAELLAALAIVDYVVVPSEPQVLDGLAQRPNITVFHEEAADAERFKRLAEHVRRRYAAPVAQH